MHYVPYKNEEMQGLSLQLHREIPESLNAALYLSLLPYSVQLDPVDILSLNKRVNAVNENEHKNKW